MTMLTTEINNTMKVQKYVSPKKRYPTDKYWIGLFVVVFAIWVASWQYLSYHEADYNIKPSICNGLQSVDNSTGIKMVSEDCRTTNQTLFWISPLWGYYWLFDAMTFNIGFIDIHYKISGPTVVALHIIVSVGLIIYGLVSMRSDHVFCKQIKYFGRPFLAFVLYYRFLMYLPNRSELISRVVFDKKIIFWVIPELLFIMIWATKKSPKKAVSADDDHDDDDDDDENENENDGDKKKIIFRKFMGYVGLVGVTLFASIEILILVTTTRIYQLHADNPLFYIIAAGSLYVGLTVFYFGLMVISCATCISYEKQRTSLKDLMIAFYIMGRHHFGTACYHATLIIPRIHATIVANESEFRKAEGSMALDRLHTTHYKIYNLSPIFTAVRGKSHSESIRKMMRLFKTKSTKVEQFQGFSEMCKNFFALIMGANNLMLILLWTHGAVVDPTFLMGTWVMYLCTIFLNYIFMRAHDAAADTIWFHAEKEEDVEF